MSLILPALVILFFAGVVFDAWRGYRSFWQLSQVTGTLAVWPRVSLIVAARNEERKIAAGIESLLALDYLELELIVVNDRSTDQTGRVLQQLAARDSRIEIVTVSELPVGWLGKNHALHLAAAKARGELLLFTDADVMLAPDTLRRAVTHMQSAGLDHLTLSPHVIAPTLPLAVFVSAFAFFFSLYARPWKARDPKSKAHVGVGAFNLVKTSLYRGFGGHERIRMRPDDDMMLGKLVKISGGRQDFLSGNDFVKVEWYASLPEAIDGLMKNAFSGVQYSVPLLVIATILQVTFNVWPFAAVFLTAGLTRVAYLLAVLVILSVIALFAHRSRFPVWYALFFPLTVLLFLFVIWKAAVRTLRDGGIRWRETFYPLEELRANRL